MLDITSGEVTKGRITANDVKPKKWVGVISVVFKPNHRKTFAVVANAVSSMVNLFAYFPDPALDVLIVEYEVVVEDAPRDLKI